MNLEIFTLCDAATVQDGKMNILGSFDTLSAARFPSNHASCVIACKLRTTEFEDEHPLDMEMHIIDPDGQSVVPPTKCRIQGGDGLHQHLWHFREFPLPMPGTFFIDLLVNGELVARNPLFVRRSGAISN